MQEPALSIVVPAFNEEHYLPRCLECIERAAARVDVPVEVIVVDNASTDRTGDIAREHGARVVVEGAKCLSIIRNRGAAAARGEYLAFVDADSYMSANMLEEILKVMKSGKYIGGGVANTRPDRMSLGMLFCALVFLPFVVLFVRGACCMFYTRRETFEAIGGFNEELYSIEDIDFANRLRAYGKARKLKYKNLVRGRLTTSARKFDEFGDWFLVRHPGFMWKVLRNDRSVAHEFWYRDRR